jgi:hypothetical protein
VRIVALLNYAPRGALDDSKGLEVIAVYVEIALEANSSSACGGDEAPDEASRPVATTVGGRLVIAND